MKDQYIWCLNKNFMDMQRRAFIHNRITSYASTDFLYFQLNNFKFPAKEWFSDSDKVLKMLEKWSI